MTAIYLGATLSRHPWLLEHVAVPLQAAGHIVTSRWVLLPDGNDEALDAKALSVNPRAGIIPATVCLEDIDRANTVAIFTDMPSSTGGYHTELGYALGREKRIVIVGPMPNVFYTLPGIERYATIVDFMKAWGLR